MAVLQCLLVAGLLFILQVNAGPKTQTNNVPWGLARVSHRYAWTPSGKAGGNNKYNYFTDVVNEITAYVIDTGVLASHTEFEGRARQAVSFYPGEKDCDMNGHGTHVAGTIAGKTYGICKTCKIVGVKVCGRQGCIGVVEAIDWVIRDCRDGSKCVINLSLGGGANQATDDAVKRAADKGIAVIVAGGNESQDACRVSPARAPAAYCAAASNVNDGFASFSNYGTCVEAITPGVDVLSSFINNRPEEACDNNTPVSDTTYASGTSMASPHFAGLAAYLRSIGMGGKTAYETYEILTQYSQTGKITNPPRGTPNLLGFNGFWN